MNVLRMLRHQSLNCYVILETDVMRTLGNVTRVRGQQTLSLQQSRKCEGVDAHIAGDSSVISSQFSSEFADHYVLVCLF